MKLTGSPPRLELSATDLSNFLGCRHRTALDMAAAHGSLAAPRREEDPTVQALRARGLEHEQRYVDSLRAEGRQVLDLQECGKQGRDAHVAATTDAMKAGADVIVQGALRDGRWFGKPDVLRRIPTPAGTRSAFGDWAYEVIDTKLSRETKAGTILQLGLYSEMLAQVQQLRPERFYVVTPDPKHPRHDFRLDDFAAYFRMVRRQMLGAVEQDHDVVARQYYPEPVTHCETCNWGQRCDDKRHADDHLSLVAFMSRLHRREMEALGVTTLADFGRITFPETFKPKRGSVETYVAAREQARIQLESREQKKVLFELKPLVETKDEGLCRLPEPSPGDVFLDLEGAPFATEGGREYLFGVVTLSEEQPNQTLKRPNAQTPNRFSYQAFWGFTASQERESFEAVMDLITARRARWPEMHVYHYAPYEPTAFKKLMGRHVSRERELDHLLRNEVFVDLYAVVRQGIRVGTESYSIKKLEPLYDFRRAVHLMEASRCLREVELALDMGSPHAIADETREAVERYNEDDCVSTLRLRDWLETVRAEHIAKGMDIPRPAAPAAELKPLTDREKRIAGLREKLLKGVPEEREQRDEMQHANWLLAYLLDYHQREDKAVWWEYFRLRDLPDEDLFDEPNAIAQLEFVETVDRKLSVRGKPTGTVTDRYRYPPQEMEIDRGAVRIREGTGDFGKVVAVDRAARTVDIQKGPANAAIHPASVFAFSFVPTETLEAAICEIATQIAEGGSMDPDDGGADRAGRALLLARPPRLTKEKFAPKPGENTLDYLQRVVRSLDCCVLPVQGPPGSGKTFSGAHMICTLVAAGKKVGIAGSSHKVICNFLDAVQKEAKSRRTIVPMGRKIGSDDEPDPSTRIREYTDNKDVAQALEAGDIQVAGGTAWLWSHPALLDSVDVLFVDEAGQMSLASVLAMTRGAKSVVLLGDPQQLEQPKKGSHPDGVGVSALEHMLAGHVTVPADRGVFLPTTWRLCPAICEFTSELFYESRLTPVDGLASQRLNGAGEYDGGGLWVVHAEHDGNRTSSQEEIEIVAGLVQRLTAPGVTWTDAHRKKQPLTGADILIVAPYNAQVSRLIERLDGTGARVGTVDKFQGQEAPVVIYSMATSRPEDAPRGMEFLYSVNRLNVATSRARCAAIVVASERLFEPECRTPRQMQLANALCRFRELASALAQLSKTVASPQSLPHRAL